MKEDESGLVGCDVSWGWCGRGVLVGMYGVIERYAAVRAVFCGPWFVGGLNQGIIQRVVH